MLSNILMFGIALLLAGTWWHLPYSLKTNKSTSYLMLAALINVIVFALCFEFSGNNAAIALIVLTTYFSLLGCLLLAETCMIRTRVSPKDERCY